MHNRTEFGKIKRGIFTVHFSDSLLEFLGQVAQAPDFLLIRIGSGAI